MRVCPTCFGLYGPDQATCTLDGSKTLHHTEVLIGLSLGPYVVRSLIGEGGMGMVYAGEHPKLGRRVALKILRPELSLREDIVERFVQEARAVNTIGHQNIVNIYDFGRTPFGSFYFVMEHLDGRTVRQLLDVSGTQPLARVRLVIQGVGTALAAAHAKGFIHRDVKPENIIVTQRMGQEQVKLLDFGIAKLLTARPDQRTMTGAGMGTPQYMSPEQLEEAPIDHRADIYALGAVTYEMLTGQVPFPGKSHGEVRQLQLTRTPTPPSACHQGANLSRSLDEVILWALAQDPKARCPRIEDFLDAFQAGYERTLVEQTHSPSTLSLPRLFSRPRLLLVLAALALAVASGALAALLIQERNTSEQVVQTHQGADAASPAADASPPPQVQDPTQAAAQARKMVKEALHSEKAATRALMATIIGELKKPPLVAELRAALQDPNPKVVQRSALALGAIGDRTAIPALRQALAGSLRFKALDIATALAELGDEQGIKRLRQELEDPRATELHKTYALHALGRLADPSAKKWRAYLAGKRLIVPQLRTRALGYLAQLGDTRAKKQLRMLTEEGSWSQRLDAAIALSPSAPHLAGPLLIKALENTKGKHRLQAAVALANMSSEKAAGALVEFLTDGDDEARYQSAVALGKLSFAAADAKLAQALADPVPRVALAAAAVLASR